MKPPRYEQGCAGHCLDRKGRPRDGDQWVHIYGRTSWVCGPCARRLAVQAGIAEPQYISLVVPPRDVQLGLGLGLMPETHSRHQARRA